VVVEADMVVEFLAPVIVRLANSNPAHDLRVVHSSRRRARTVMIVFWRRNDVVKAGFRYSQPRGQTTRDEKAVSEGRRR
jgi:hypothetical protein